MELLRRGARSALTSYPRPRTSTLHPSTTTTTAAQAVASHALSDSSLAACPPWRLLATRSLRNFRVTVLMRNQSFIRKAKSSFEVEKEWELGIELQPSEVKALRERNGDLSAAFAEFYKHELFIHQLHIPGKG